MRRFFSCYFSAVFFLLLYIFLLPVLEAQTVLDMQLPGDTIGETEGRGLLIRSNPRGAKVYVDGIERGSTPLRLEDLRAGTYNVRLKKDGFGERSFQVSIKVGSVMNISLELKASVGRIILRIQPAQDGFDAEMLPFNPVISVDGKSSQQPALELPVGFRTIRVRAFGWEDFVATEYIEEDSFKELDIFLNAAPFRLTGYGVNRSVFNPANPGSLGKVIYNFEVSAPGRGVFTVEDDKGVTVYHSYLEDFESRQQAVVWDGYDWKGNISGNGIYTLIIKARSYNFPVEESISAEVTIDSSELIYPLTVSSGKSGLLYAPFPELLPARSFQIEGSLLAGDPPGSGESQDSNPWNSLPFSAAFRVSPIKKLELAAAVNMVPFFEGGINTGFAGSAKWAFFKSGNMPLGFASGFVFSWTGKNAITPFGMASGFEFFFPLSVDFGKLFTFAITPAALWTGKEGFPWEPAPRLLVSGGLLMRLRYFLPGLSLRSEFDFSSGNSWPPSLLIGGEVKIFPPPSVFVFSVMGGCWIRNNNRGGFGGIAIGMIY